MKVSTRSRYGLRMMIAFADHYGKGYLTLKEVAEEEGISEKYLGQLVIPLKAAGLIVAGQGAKGGYMLVRHPGEISMKDILEPLEGDLVLVDCVETPSACSRSSRCRAKHVWTVLGRNMMDELDGISLDVLANNPQRIKKRIRG